MGLSVEGSARCCCKEWSARRSLGGAFVAETWGAERSGLGCSPEY